VAAVPAQVRDAFTDQRWRLNNLYWITDKEGKRVRFEMNWAQEELLNDWHFLNIILKARQLGFTTFIQILMLDATVFFPNTRCGVIAHTLPDAEAIFRDKIKYPYDNLPEGIKAASPIVRDNTTTLELANNSIIRVGTSLRGGTLQYLHVSEFGKICARNPKKAKEIVTGALNTIDAGQVAFIESTAEGQEGAFFDMCEVAQSKQRLGQDLTPMDWKFHFFPWWKEPNYRLAGPVDIPASLVKYFGELEADGIILDAEQRAWYAKKAETQQEDMKREFPSTPKEAFEASIEGAYYAQQIAKAELDGRIDRVPYEPQLPVETWWDLGINDSTSIWFVQRHGREIRVIDHYANSGEGLAHYAGVLNSKGYVYGRHIGPHDIEVRELGTGKSRREVAEGLGIRPLVTAPALPVVDGIEAVRNMMARCWFDKEKCADGLKSLRTYRKEWDADRGVWKSQPRHDGASHDADAFRTGAVMAEPPPRSEQPRRVARGGWMGR
jgi:hypothetical protein